MSLPNRIADRYDVLGLLGRGGGGTVYLVADTFRGRKEMALKTVAVPKRGSSSMLADLKEEFATLRLLQHPNLARVHDFGTTKAEMFFTSEWVRGKDLLVAVDQIDFNAIFDLIVQILRAVDFIHRRGVLHHDLKPGNILVTDPDATGELRVKLIDFGIAQWKLHGRMQGTGFLGTPPYAAPEIYKANERSPAADIYSLGMVFHRIFAKRFPFPTQEPFEILAMQQRRDPEHLGAIDPALPREFSDILHRMVARDPKARFQTPGQVLEAINACLGEQYSLRSQTAPIHILEELEQEFHPDLSRRLTDFALSKKNALIGLVGPAGSGKSFMLQAVKSAIQLQGLRSYFFQDLSEYREFLQSAPQEGAPVSLDLSSADEVGEIGGLPRGQAPGPLLIGLADLSLAKKMNLDEVLEIPPLDCQSLAEFFKKSIRAAPKGLAASVLEGLGTILPRQLEDLLQAFREVRLLYWSDQGWHWRGKESPDVPTIARRSAEIWERRKRNVLEILRVSHLSLPESVLEGVIGVDPGFLEERMKQWVREDLLKASWVEGFRHFSIPGASRGADLPRGLAKDPAWLEEQLKSLYDQGKFAVGVAWTEALKREKGRDFSARVSIYAARHWVAEGFAKNALEWLPREVPADSQDRGLYYEIQARARHLQGSLGQAERDLVLAWEAYQNAGDSSGLARVSNMKGSVAKAAAEMEKAEKFYAESVVLAQGAGDFYCEGSARVNLGLTLQEQGKIEAAYQAYRSAWKLTKKVIHPRFTQTLFHNWINLMHHMGRSSHAEKACYEWLHLAIDHGDLEQQASALNYLALFAGQKKLRDLQGSFLNQAIHLLNPKKSPRLLAQILTNRALLFWSMEKFSPGRRDADRAMKLLAEETDPPLKAWILLVLGKISRDRPKPDLMEAGRHLAEARRIADKNKIGQLLWEIEYNRGILEKNKGDPKAARKHYVEAEMALQELEGNLPPALKESYLRDRKADRICRELQSLSRIFSMSRSKK